MSGIGTGLALKIGARLTGVSGALKRVPRWAWIALAIVIAVVAVTIWHGRQVAGHDKALIADTVERRDTAWKKHFDRMHAVAIAWRGVAETRGRTIAQMQRSNLNEELSRIDRSAGAMLLRGPGKAAAQACGGPGNHPGLAAPARGYDEAGRPVDAGMGQVPDGRGADFITLPWAGAVAFARVCDANRAEALTWRTNDPLQREAWDRMRAELAKGAAK